MEVYLPEQYDKRSFNIVGSVPFRSRAWQRYYFDTDLAKEIDEYLVRFYGWRDPTEHLRLKFLKSCSVADRATLLNAHEEKELSEMQLKWNLVEFDRIFEHKIREDGDFDDEKPPAHTLKLFSVKNDEKFLISDWGEVRKGTTCAKCTAPLSLEQYYFYKKDKHLCVKCAEL